MVNIDLPNYMAISQADAMLCYGYPIGQVGPFVQTTTSAPYDRHKRQDRQHIKFSL